VSKREYSFFFFERSLTEIYKIYSFTYRIQHTSAVRGFWMQLKRSTDVMVQYKTMPIHNDERIEYFGKISYYFF
jgi:hypothetical protein